MKAIELFVLAEDDHLGIETRVKVKIVGLGSENDCSCSSCSTKCSISLRVKKYICKDNNNDSNILYDAPWIHFTCYLIHNKKKIMNFITILLQNSCFIQMSKQNCFMIIVTCRN